MDDACIRWKQGVKPVFAPITLSDQPDVPQVDDPTSLKTRGKTGTSKIRPKYKVGGKVIGTVGGDPEDDKTISNQFRGDSSVGRSTSHQSFGRSPSDRSFAMHKPELSARFKGCWALDNVMVVNLANPPSHMQDNFDPIDPSNWVFFPGANIKV